MTTERCIKCGIIMDCGWVENPSEDWACDFANTAHEIVPLYWVRHQPGDQAVANKDQAVARALFVKKSK